jgi:hypothetical protein
MSSRATRVVRGLSAAAIALFVAALSHVAAGGGAPGQAGTALAAAFAAIVCIALAGRRLSVTRLTIAVVTSQFVFHLLFGVGSGSGSGLSVTTSQHHGRTVSTLVPDALAAAPVAPTGHLHDSPWMWLAHGVAAVITVALLARGENVARRLLAIARHRLWEPVGVLLAAVHSLRSVLAGSLLAAAVTENSSVGHRLRRRSRLFGETVAPSLLEGLLTLGTLGHRGPPRVADAHPSF